MNKEEIYKKAFIIRTFEKLLLFLFEKGMIKGTTHTSIGQELIPVLALDNLHERDYVISNHRSHAHFISYANDYEKLLDEILGNAQGVCGGKGGSQHIHYKRFYSNGVLGNLVPVANGMALGEKKMKKDGISILFLGDGTFGEGVVYESFNLSKIYSIPILYIVENNFIAQTTKLDDNLSGTLKDRFLAFDIPCNEIDDQDLNLMQEIFNEKLEFVRQNSSPTSIIVNTQRLAAHSKGDDTRDKVYLDKLLSNDPLKRLSSDISKLSLKKINHDVLEDFKQKLEKRNIDGSNFLKIS